MSFQHTLYLKRDSEEVKDQPEHLDGTKYHWVMGARDFADTVKRFGTKVNDYIFEFNSNQVARLLADLMAEFMQHYEVYDKAYDDFLTNVKYNDSLSADMRCIESYAIIRSLDNKMEELPDYYYTQFAELFRMIRIIKALTSLTSRMKEDDILVWVVD